MLAIGKFEKGINDLASTHPELLTEWDYLKNTISPEDIGQYSYEEANWICSQCGKKYVAKIRSKSMHGIGCSECHRKAGAEKRAKIAIEKNGNLFSNNPVLCKEWDYERNEHSPEDYASGSHEFAYWICAICGNRWNAQIKSRAISGRGCPNCATRMQSSFPEQAFLFYVKKIFPDAENRATQFFENKMELDIYIPSLKLGIEYDGKAWHASRASYEREKIKYEVCKNLGISLIRIREVVDDVDSAAIADKVIWCDYRVGEYKALDKAIASFFEFIHVKIDISTERDYNAIHEQYITNLKDNSLMSLFPEVASEWDIEGNGSLRPNMFSPGSNYKAAWKCQKCGYKWKVSITSRISKGGTGCPKCGNATVADKAHKRHLIQGKTDLLSQFPEIASEWDQELNGELLPEHVTYGSHEKVYWKCKDCGYVWSVSPNARTNHKSGCPACGNAKKIKSRQERELKEKGSLAEHFPELLDEWNYALNKEVDPYAIVPNSSYRANWKCRNCGREWATKVVRRTKDKSGCPSCSKKKNRT